MPEMNRTGRCCWSPRPLLLQPVLLLLLALAVGAAQAESQPNNDLDPAVAGVRTVFDDVLSGGSQAGKSLRGTGRTFGHKRIQFMLMPMVYKMGVMMTMMAVLTVISLKGLMIGVILLVLKLSAIFGKLYAGSGHSPGWSASQQPLHVHVHNSGYGAHSQAYSGWEPHGPPPDDGYYYKG